MAKAATQEKQRRKPERATRPASEPQPAPARRWPSRIVGHADVAPDQLLANPFNWRVHSQLQQKLTEDVLDAVGWLSEVMVNQPTGNMVDGHMRVMLALRREEPTVPVRYVDLTPEEEKLALATFDEVARYAAPDLAALSRLRAELPAAAPGLALITQIHEQNFRRAEPPQAPGAFPTVGEDLKTDHTCPRCGYKFSGGK